MRSDYKDWLVARQYAANTQQAQLHRVRKVEEAYGDLEERFRQGTLDEVVQDLSYGTDDERQNRPNPSRLAIEGSVRKGLQSFKGAVVRYRDFLTSSGGALPLEAVPSWDEAGSADLEPVRQRFALERDMQAELRRNISKLSASLKIVDDGAERSVESGFIDIMCETIAGELVVVELKAGTADSRAIGQILGYMGDVASEEPGRVVRGLLIAHDFDRRVRSAARVIPSLRLVRYSIDFQFEFEPAAGTTT